jgi:hypothetical protein
VDIRDDLAYRKASGEMLDPDELERLERLNAELEALLPKPQGLPPEVRELIRKAIRFGKQRAGDPTGEIEIDVGDL